MRNFSLLGTFLFISLTTWSNPTPSPKGVALSAAPREVQKAISLSAYIEENHLQSQLDGKTKGFVIARVELETKNRFHLYEDRLKFSSEGDWVAELISTPDTVNFLDPVSKSLKKGYRGQNIFRVKLLLNRELNEPPLPDQKVPLFVDLQACNESLCLLPITISTPISLSAPQASTENSGILSRLSAFTQKHMTSVQKFSFMTILTLLVAGVLTALTPCVYPLYPLAIGMFSRWSQSAHLPPLLLVVVYCLSMILSYSVLGLLSAASGIVFGSLTQTPFFLLGVGGLILLSALFFSGLLNFSVPTKLLNLVGAASSDTPRSKATALLHAAGMGFGLGIVASPCVGPVLLALLAWLGSALAASESGAWIKGFLLLSVFGVGMCIPFFVLATLIIKLHKRPSMGAYTNIVKYIGSALMVVGSLFFIVPGLKLAFASKVEKASFSFPQHDIANFKPGHWSVIDFRADWCAACLQLENETFSQSPTREFFEKNEWHFVKADLSIMTDQNKELAARYGIVSLPTVLFVNPDGTICKAHTLNAFENSAAFAARLEAAKRSCQ